MSESRAAMLAGAAALSVAREEIESLRAKNDALARRCRELEEAVERMDGCNRAIAADALAACSERDTLRAEVERLTGCLHRANQQAEHFEREWYLRGDEVERLQTINYRQEQQIVTLTADPNGWQAGYNKGRHDGTKTRLSELEQERRINRELRALLGKESEDHE